jgi:2-oxoglutarate ferredoxin oxidoreductase subunit delta
MNEVFRSVRINEDRCKGCYLCISVCPKSCLEVGSHLNQRGLNPAVLMRPEDCIACMNCATMCPEGIQFLLSPGSTGILPAV